MASEVPWKRLHPVSVFVNLVPRIWSTIRNTWYLFAAILFGRMGQADTAQGAFDLSLVLLFFGIAVGNTVVHYLTLRYRVVGGQLEIQSGLLNRQARVIGADRIQNMEMVRNVFHRLSGMVEVRIETASGTDVEGLLSALSVRDAQALIDALDAARGERAPVQAAEEDGELILTNGPVELAWFGATAPRFGLIAAVMGIGYELLLLDPEWLNDDLRQTTEGLFTSGSGALLALAVISAAWFASTVAALVQHYGFRLTRTERALVAERGLLTRRRAVLRMGKVQLVTVLEPVLRRLAGFTSVSIETAAAQEGGDGTQRSEAMIPYVMAGDVPALVHAAVPHLTCENPLTVPLRPAHPRALARAVWRATLQSGIAAAAIGWFWYPFGLLGLALVPFAIVLAVLDHRHQGWAVEGDLIISRRGWLTRRTRLLPRAKVQSTTVDQTIFLRQIGLGRLLVRVAGSRIALPLMAWDEALALQQRLLQERG